MVNTERIIKLLNELHTLALKGPNSLLGDAQLRQVGFLRKQIRNEIAILQLAGRYDGITRLDVVLRSDIIAAIDMELTTPRAAAAIKAVIDRVPVLSD